MEGPTLAQLDDTLLFEKTIEVREPLAPEQIVERTFYLIREQTPLAAFFRCPCGCCDIVRIAIEIEPGLPSSFEEIDGKPTLQRAVHRDTGCRSHFWIRAGRVKWSPDTGIPLLLY